MGGRKVYQPVDLQRGLPIDESAKWRRKLSPEQVDEMRRLCAAGMTKVAIAKQFGVSETHARQVINGTKWPNENTSPEKVVETREKRRVAQRQWRERNRAQSRLVARRYREMNPDKVRERQTAYRRRNFRKRLYGLTLEQFEAMSAAHDGKCTICGQPESPLHVDHDHVSGIIRGLLCDRCNKGLGAFRDNPESCRAAAKYLEASRRDAGAR